MKPNEFDGLTLTEMRALQRMNIALKAFGKTKNVNRKKIEMRKYMKKQKYYFKDIDSEMCYPLSLHIEEAKSWGLKEIELIEAIPDPDNPEYIWCASADAVGEKSECNKNCTDYEPLRGKTCKHKGKLFEHGEIVRFNVETSEKQL